jgi:HEAT repeat protein
VKSFRIVLAAAAVFLWTGATSNPAAGQTPGPSLSQFPVYKALVETARDQHRPLKERLSAIEEMGGAAHPALLPVLIESLDDQNALVRRAAAIALGASGNAASVPPLLRRMDSEEETIEVRQAAATSLGKIGDVAALPSLRRLAGHATPGLRQSALLALTDSALAASVDRVPYAIQLLDDRALAATERARAATLLGSLRDPRGLGPLIEALRDPPSLSEPPRLPDPARLQGQARTYAQRLRSLHNVPAHAARALGALGDPAAAEPLIQALTDRNAFVRAASAASLGALRARQAVPSLIRALEDDEASVRRAAVQSLGLLGDSAAVPPLLGSLRDANPQVRLQAALVLGALGDARAREGLMLAVEQDSEPRVRAAAKAALSKLDRAAPTPK